MDDRRGKKKRLYLNARRRSRKLAIRRAHQQRRLLSSVETDESMMHKEINDCEPGPSSNVSTSSLCEDNTVELLSIRESDEPRSPCEPGPSSMVSTSSWCEDNATVSPSDFRENSIESKKPTPTLKTSEGMQGRRVVDVQYFLEQIQATEGHRPECRIKNLRIEGEQRFGFQTNMHFKCTYCGDSFDVQAAKGEGNDINFSAVAGIMKIGSGYRHLEEFTNALDVPVMAKKTFQKYHDDVCDTIESEALEAMKEAAMEEKQIAISEGSIDYDGIPLVTVVCDGTWSKRSYKTKYNALSGAATIIGLKTKKVLWMEVKNRYCKICATEKKDNPVPHVCYKNHTGSAGSIEATGVVEAFCKSEKLYGIRYNRFIADGDASVFKRLLDARPYQNTEISKVECRNHLLRNYCKKLSDLGKDTAVARLPIRKILQENVLKLRSATTAAIKFRKLQVGSLSTKINDLRLDILNSASHVFGEHKKCAERKYFCAKTEPDKENFIPEFKTTGFYDKLMKIVRFLSGHASSLIFDLDSNTVEQFHSLITKFIAGKRINYTQRRSYIARCQYATLSRNINKPFCAIYKKKFGINPGKYASGVESRKKQQLKKKVKRHYSRDVSNKDYGPDCEKVELSSEDLQEAKRQYVADLLRTEDERRAIELRTREQSNSKEWIELRRNLLTASNFGTVCRMLPHTSCKNLVYNILYAPPSKNVASLEYGKRFEALAINDFAKKYNVNVTKCGLFVDDRIPYLAATPDGIIESECIIEVKCPYAARRLTPEQAIAEKKILFWTKVVEDNKENYIVNKKCKWFYQIQGQLYITKMDYCWFIVWTPYGMKCEQIVRDEEFWASQMEEKLKNFFENCMLPEIITQHKKKDDIKDPEYIVLAKQRYFASKADLQAKKQIRAARKEAIKIKNKNGSDSEDEIPVTKKFKHKI